MIDRLGRQGCLGHQKLKKEYFAGPCFLCSGGSLASSSMGQTCPKTPFYPLFLKFFCLKTWLFCFWRIFCSWKSCFRQIFHHCLRIGILFFSWMVKTSLIQQFKQIPYIYNYTFYVRKMWQKNFLTFWLGFVYKFLGVFLKWYLKNHKAHKPIIWGVLNHLILKTYIAIS